MTSLDDMSNNESSESADDTDHQPWHDYQSLTISVLCGIAIGSIVLNSYVLLSAKFLKRPVSFNLVLSLSLAAADGWSGFLIVLNLLLNRADIFDFLMPHRCFLLAIEMFRLSSFAVSVFHLLALALNHFVSIVYPMQHKTLLRNRFKAAVVTFIWIFPPICIFCFAIFVPNQGFRSTDCEDLTFVQTSFMFRNIVCSVIFIPMLITFCLYFVIVFSLRHAQRNPLLTNSRTSNKNSRKLLGTMILLMGTFVLGWLPCILFYLLTCPTCPLATLFHSNPLVWFILVTITFSLTILKLFSNPFIYALRINELRRALWKMNFYCLCKAKILRVVSQNNTRERRTTNNNNSRKYTLETKCSPNGKRRSSNINGNESSCNKRNSSLKRARSMPVCKRLPEIRVVVCVQNDVTNR